MLNNAYRIAAAVIAALLLTAAIASAQDSRVVSPSSLPGGLTYEEWSAKWWQWAESSPADENPIALTPYPPGYDCGMGQDSNSPVFFLAGTFGKTTTRNCNIPPQKMIFFPIVNLLNDFPCPDPSFAPGPKQSLEQFLTIGYRPNIGARQFIDHATELSATLDGAPIHVDLSLPPAASPFRATSSIFEFKGDRSLTVFDPCITGGGQHGVSDGYWIMLTPLSPGQHNLHFRGTESFLEFPPPNTFTVDVTYYLTVAK